MLTEEQKTRRRAILLPILGVVVTLRLMLLVHEVHQRHAREAAAAAAHAPAPPVGTPAPAR